ncbi:uncharacterized protein [Paramisgurnus dabryanus]|uniref:uncharacterized protein n=1 Tax=Paramisgurnus dabryanus TaxID=90735 RepID=UPI003CCFC091
MVQGLQLLILMQEVVMGITFEVTGVNATVIDRGTKSNYNSDKKCNSLKLSHDGSNSVDEHNAQKLCTTKSNQKCIDSSKIKTQNEHESKLKQVNDHFLMDDIVIGETLNKEFTFQPLTSVDQDALCTSLQLTNEYNGVQGRTLCFLRVPCKTKSIKGDGNCFYRSIAHAVCGNEDKHLKIRRAVVKHLEANSSKFVRYLREEYRSVKDYLTQCRMYYSGSWATEIDIFCTADLLKINIFTFNDDRWNVHTPTGHSFTENAIYLNHCNSNHYEVVTCVKSQDNVCAEACKGAGDDNSIKQRLRKRKSNEPIEHCKSKRERERFQTKKIAEPKSKIF